jgi:Ser/Thr protein kinase RdoA (MazF antagonist)
VYWLWQKDAGCSLAGYIQGLEKVCCFDQVQTAFDSIMVVLCAHLKEMHLAGVVHGDLHPGNVCVKSVGEVYEVALIDFGWCLCAKFDLGDFEHDQLASALMHNEDWNHFRRSLVGFNLDKYDRAR